MLFPFVLPLAEITFLTPPTRQIATEDSILSQHLIGAVPSMELMVALAILVGLLMVLLGLRRGGRSRRPAIRRKGSPRSGRGPNWIVVDGSNVMHWKNETAMIFPVQAVVKELRARGFSPGVVFDANAGYKLSGRYMNEDEFATLLTLPTDQVFVVPKGTPADPWILKAARDFNARIVTRDRFRDWAADHPEIAKPGHLIRGGYRDSGALWLDDTAPAEPVR